MRTKIIALIALTQLAACQIKPNNAAVTYDADLHCGIPEDVTVDPRLIESGYTDVAQQTCVNHVCSSPQINTHEQVVIVQNLGGYDIEAAIRDQGISGVTVTADSRMDCFVNGEGILNCTGTIVRFDEPTDAQKFLDTCGFENLDD